MKMIQWALWWWCIAIACAVLGFSEAVPAIAGICKVLFFIFLILCLVAMIAGAFNHRERR